MTYRIGWLSPLTPTSGVGTFSHAIVRNFPKTFNSEPIDLTIFYVGHCRLYQSEHRSIQIGDGEDFHQILTLFDLLIYNIGNNREHHEGIFRLLRLHPGIIISHDYVYQHYLADRSLRSGKSFSSFAALLLKYGDESTTDYLHRSRITSRTGRIRYSPWDSEASVFQPMSESLFALGSALIVHSAFAQHYAERRFQGPIVRLGMPHDQKPLTRESDLAVWEGTITTKPFFNLVSFGHIQATKCIDFVLSAIAASPVLQKRIRYTVAGFVADYTYFDRLKTMVSSMSLQTVVSFELDVSEARLNELIQLADVFSNLRRPNTEGSSVSLIEQLDTGKPVVVLDSGCYAEIPSGAAIKLPPDVTSDHIKTALESLLSDPELMPAIGRAGRAYARSWTCASYANHVMKFLYDNRTLLESRAHAIAIRSKPLPTLIEADPWIRELACARLSLNYLDRNVLAIDPTIVLGQTTEQLCDYTAGVILGMFGNAKLKRALSRFFVRLDTHAAYWACVRFALIVKAVFGDDEEARDRLCNLKPCYDPEFWSVIETFPSYQYIFAVTLILMKRIPNQDELSAVGLDDQDGFPKRLRMSEILRTVEQASGPALERLGGWLDESCAPSLDRDLVCLETNLDCEVGSQTFRDKVDLSGFYSMEADHAWTRGHQGFLGVRLPNAPCNLDFLIRHIDASPGRPCTISVAYEVDASTFEVEDCTAKWLSLKIPGPGTTRAKVTWIKFSTNVAGTPSNSSDTRLLGLCFLKLRVRILDEPKTIGDASVSVHEVLPRVNHHTPPAPPRFGRRQPAWLER